MTWKLLNSLLVWQKHKPFVLSLGISVFLTLPSNGVAANDNLDWLQRYHSQPSDPPGLPTEKELQRAKEWLSTTLGIEGLCHPTSKGYDPVFPHCGDLTTTRTEDDHPVSSRTSFSTSRRHLEGDYYSQFENNHYQEDDNQQDEMKEGWNYIVNGSLSLLCVVACALASGLTVGLMSLDPLLLVIKMRAADSEQERHQAGQLLPLVKQHHQLLVTLLLLNTIAGEALPIYLQAMVPGSVAVIGSVILVLIFGEILPTSLFTGRHQIRIASKLAPIVRFLMAVMLPLTYPIAKLLDRIMHDDEDDNGDGEGTVGGTLYNRGELAALIRVQHEERLAAKQRRKHQRVSSLASIPDLDTSGLQAASDVRVLKDALLQQQQHRSVPDSDSIDCDEVTMIEGALQMKTKTAVDIFLSYHKVFCVPHDMVLDDSNIFTIYASGYSRVPVFVNGDRRQVKGILMTRQLMVVKRQQHGHDKDRKDLMKISDLSLHVPQCVAPHTNLVNLVKMFQTGGSAVRAGHMALVCARPDIAYEALDKDEAVPEEAGLMGIITLEDVLEALLQEEIYDEMDAVGRMPAASDLEPIEDESGNYQLV